MFHSQRSIGHQRQSFIKLGFGLSSLLLSNCFYISLIHSQSHVSRYFLAVLSFSPVVPSHGLVGNAECWSLKSASYPTPLSLQDLFTLLPNCVQLDFVIIEKWIFMIISQNCSSLFYILSIVFFSAEIVLLYLLLHSKSVFTLFCQLF